MVPDISTVKELHWILRLIDEPKSSCMGSLCISVRWNYLPEGHCVTHIWLSSNHHTSLYETMRRTMAHLLFNTSICWFSKWITKFFSRSAIIHAVSIKCQEQEPNGMYYAVVYYVLCCGVMSGGRVWWHALCCGVLCIMLWCIMYYAVVYYVLCCGVLCIMLWCNNEDIEDR